MRLPLALVFTSAILLAQATRDLGVEFDAAPLPDKRDRWAVVIGVSSYKYVPPAAQQIGRAHV